MHLTLTRVVERRMVGGDIAHQNAPRKSKKHVKELFVTYPMNNVTIESVPQDMTKHAKALFVM